MAKYHADAAIHSARSFASRHEGVTSAYERLLLYAHRHTRLLRPIRYCTVQHAGLLALAVHHQDWLRPIERWLPPARSAWPQFASMAQHLLAQYPLPHFMVTVWFEFPPGKKLQCHEWYKWLGLGESLRNLDLPIALTKAMVHWFNQAPDHYTIIKAIRWGQVRGLGGDEKLASVIAETRLGTVLENEDFWLTVIRFFIACPNVDLEQINPIVDFLQYQRFEPRDAYFLGAQATGKPLQPDYSMKGRSWRSMLRQVEEWHKQLGKLESKIRLTWKHSRISDFEFIEDHPALETVRRWTITELLTNTDLLDEGRTLHHCVATYTKNCARRFTTIWSMKLDTKHGRRSVLTVEVDRNKKTICQARGKSNRRPVKHERDILQQWATKEGLSIAAHL